MAAERARFPSTRWTLVIAAGSDPSPEADAALATLCQAYWFPLYVFLRRDGHDADEAADLTQAFFVYLLEKRTLRRADHARGRFRSFLLTSLKNFALNERDRQRAVKRGAGAVMPLEAAAAEGRFQLQLVTNETPDRMFDRQWALTLLDRVMQQIEGEMTGGRSSHFQILKPYLTGESAARSYADSAAVLGMTEGAVKVAVHRLRRRFRELVRAEISETVTGPDEIDDEIRYLLSAIGR